MDTRSGDAGGSSIASTAVRGDGLRVFTLRPRRTLTRSIGLPVMALVLPLLAAELWLLDPSGAWPVVAWTGVFTRRADRRGVGRVPAHAGLGQHATASWSAGSSAAPTRSRRATSTGVLRVQLYRSNSLDTTQELFVVSRTGRGVFRMRGRFWDQRTMDRVAAILGVEETVRFEPVTLVGAAADRSRAALLVRAALAEPLTSAMGPSGAVRPPTRRESPPEQGSPPSTPERDDSSAAVLRPVIVA